MCVALFSSVLLLPSIVTCIPQHSQQVSEREREIECVCVCVCVFVSERETDKEGERDCHNVSVSRSSVYTTVLF